MSQPFRGSSKPAFPALLTNEFFLKPCRVMPAVYDSIDRSTKREPVSPRGQLCRLTRLAVPRGESDDHKEEPNEEDDGLTACEETCRAEGKENQQPEPQLVLVYKSSRQTVRKLVLIDHAGGVCNEIHKTAAVDRFSGFLHLEPVEHSFGHQRVHRGAAPTDRSLGFF